CEAIHFHQKRVQRVLTFVVCSGELPASAAASDCVNLVDKYYTGSFLLGLFEQVAHTRCTHAHEHLNEIGARQREEGHSGFSRNRLGQECLSRTGRANQEGTFRDLATKLREFTRVLEEIDNLLYFLFSLIKAGDILECYLYLVFGVKQCRLGLSDVKDLTARASATGHPAHKHPEPEQQQEEEIGRAS